MDLSNKLQIIKFTGIKEYKERKHDLADHLDKNTISISKQHHPNTHTNHQPKRSNQHPKAVRSIQSKEGKCVRIVSGSKKKPVAMTGLILYN